MSETLSSGTVTTKLQRIAELSRQRRDEALTSVAHVIDLEWMKEAFRRTRKDGAPGIDGVTSAMYATNLEENLRVLLEKFHRGTYRPPPVRRAHIPKGGGKTRPIGIPTFEDKVMQRAVAMVLEAIYEEEFYDFSYGFRPGRGAHDALKELQKRPTFWRNCWVIEADIQSFFDTIDHAKLRSLLDRRVRDGVIRKMVDKWLRAGVLEQGGLHYADAGTPQGGVISPLLANIFLHDVLDRWFECDVFPCCEGRAKLVRYADDFVMLFGWERDARRVMKVLPKRLERFGLQLHPNKTRLLSFDSPELGKPRAQRERSFDFLGFTHFWTLSRRGKFVVRQKTAKDRFTRALQKFKAQCALMMHVPIEHQHRTLSQMLRGHYGYYGITGNGDALSRFLHHATRHWGRSLARRNSRRFAWRRFTPLLVRFPLPQARPIHSVCPSEPAD